MVRKFAALCLILSLAACGEEDPDRWKPKAIPYFTLTTLNNQKYEFQTLYGDKMVVLNFWATWCAPCRQEIPALGRLARALPEESYAVVGISIDKNPILIGEYLLDREISYRNFIDPPPSDIKQLFGVDVLPTTFLIGPDGIAKERIIGIQEWDSPAMIAKIKAMGEIKGKK